MAKDQLLNSLRQRLNVNLGDQTRVQTVNARISEHKPNTVPARGRKPHKELVDDFEQRITRSQASVVRVASMAGVVAEVAQYLGHGEICVNADVLELSLDFDSAPQISLVPWIEKTSMKVCVTTCVGAVAESGSLVIASSARNAITQNFLAEKHIVLLKAEDIVGVYEQIWQKVRRDEMPRDITFVSGPSCTGDIEMIMEYGAHGPKQLHVIIIGESPIDDTPFLEA